MRADHLTPARPESRPAILPPTAQSRTMFLDLVHCIVCSAGTWVLASTVFALAVAVLEGAGDSNPFELKTIAVVFLITVISIAGFALLPFFFFGIPVFWLVRHRKGWLWKILPRGLVSVLSIGSFFVIMPVVETCQNSAEARATIAATLSDHDQSSLRGIDTQSLVATFCPATFAYARDGRQMEGSVQANPMTGPTINEHAVK